MGKPKFRKSQFLRFEQNWKKRNWKKKSNIIKKSVKQILYLYSTSKSTQISYVIRCFFVSLVENKDNLYWGTAWIWNLFFITVKAMLDSSFILSISLEAFKLIFLKFKRAQGHYSNYLLPLKITTCVMSVWNNCICFTDNALRIAPRVIMKYYIDFMKLP